MLARYMVEPRSTLVLKELGRQASKMKYLTKFIDNPGGMIVQNDPIPLLVPDQYPVDTCQYLFQNQ